MKRALMQVYVIDSVEAVELYQKTFNATLISEVRNSDDIFYMQNSMCLGIL